MEKFEMQQEIELDEITLEGIAHQVMQKFIEQQIDLSRSRIQDYKDHKWPEDMVVKPEDAEQTSKNMSGFYTEVLQALESLQGFQSIEDMDAAIQELQAEQYQIKAEDELERIRHTRFDSLTGRASVVFEGISLCLKPDRFKQSSEIAVKLGVIKRIATCYGFLIGENERGEFYNNTHKPDQEELKVDEIRFSEEKAETPGSVYYSDRQAVFSILYEMNIPDIWKSLHLDKRAIVKAHIAENEAIREAIVASIEQS